MLPAKVGKAEALEGMVAQLLNSMQPTHTYLGPPLELLQMPVTGCLSSVPPHTLPDAIPLTNQLPKAQLLESNHIPLGTNFIVQKVYLQVFVHVVSFTQSIDNSSILPDGLYLPSQLCRGVLTWGHTPIPSMLYCTSLKYLACYSTIHSRFFKGLLYASPALGADVQEMSEIQKSLPYRAYR